MSALTLELPTHVLYMDWTEDVDAPQLIQDSERLSGITNFLNLEDWRDKKTSPFLFYHPFVNDFERLRVQACEAEKVYMAYNLDSRFDSSVLKKMRVLAHQLASRVNAYVAYYELKSELCLEKHDFFYEIYSKVESRVMASSSADETEFLMSLVCNIRNLYDAYL